VKTTEFLRDIDDAELYTKRLELAYGVAHEEVLQILYDHKDDFPDLVFDNSRIRPGDQLHEVAHVLHRLQSLRMVMTLQLRAMADRRKRLADAAVGLPNGVLDEESTQGELRSDPNRGD